MIPVFLMPVFPAARGLALVLGPDVRASDADRDVGADILCAAVADGRLTLAELDERLDGVLSARTLREIARLISDLPGRKFPEPIESARRSAPGRLTDRPANSAARPAPAAPVAAPPARRRPSTGARWALLQSLLAPPPVTRPQGASG
jgi:hypothetical protein